MVEKRITRAKAIRLKCLECSAQQPSEVRCCEMKDCPLWRYRMGREERDELYENSRQKASVAKDLEN